MTIFHKRIRSVVGIMCLSIMICIVNGSVFANNLDSFAKEIKLKILNEYNEATNQKIDLYGTTFQVPKEWEKEYSKEDECYYFEPTTGLDVLKVAELPDISDKSVTLSDAKDVANIFFDNNSVKDVSLTSVSGYSNNAFMFNATAETNNESYTATSFFVLTGKRLVLFIYFRSPESLIVRNDDVIKVFQSIKLSQESLNLYNEKQTYSSGNSNYAAADAGGPWYTKSGSCYHEKYGCSGATIPYPPKNKSYRPCSKCCR